jgi:hypothetical protein
MSDYSVTHGHLADRHFPTEEDLPAAPAGIFTPVCGQCKFFVITQPHLDAPNEGYCTARREREWCGGDSYRYLHPKRDSLDPICDRYIEEIPF